MALLNTKTKRSFIAMQQWFGVSPFDAVLVFTEGYNHKAIFRLNITQWNNGNCQTTKLISLHIAHVQPQLQHTAATHVYTLLPSKVG